MSIINDMTQKHSFEAPLSEELRAGGVALMQRGGPLLLNRGDTHKLATWLLDQSKRLRAMENTVRALTEELTAEKALPSDGVVLLKHFGKVS